jgi:enoyl-CoA hydratase/carnithine racemase
VAAAARPEPRPLFLDDRAGNPAQEALALGVVNEVMPRERLLPRAWELARLLRQRPALTTRLTREVMLMEVKRALQAQLPYGLALEGLAACDYWPDHFAAENIAKRNG